MESQGTSSPYTVRLDNFEGPLDLLLFLIKEQEMDIYDIPIAVITRQYLEYLQLMQMLDLEIAGEYLVMAATLLRIKSRMLLPRETMEEEEEIGDPRQELVHQLLEYQRYKELADTLSAKEESQRLVFLRCVPPAEEEEEIDEPLQNVSLFDLLRAFRQALDRKTEPFVYPIVRPQMSVEERMAEILASLENVEKLLFWNLIATDYSRADLVITFVALLEMIRRGNVIVRQDRLFGDIWIFRTGDR